MLIYGAYLTEVRRVVTFVVYIIVQYPSPKYINGLDSLLYRPHNHVDLPEREIAQPNENTRRWAPLDVVLLRPIVEKKIAQKLYHAL